VAAHAGQPGAAESVFVGLEARPGELYLAEYDATVFEQPRLIKPFRLLTETERPEFERGRRLFRMDWSPEKESPDGVAFPPEADYLALLAAPRTNFVAGHDLEPIYLREVQFVKAPPARPNFP
jgi:tRNA A37 threonylcarbamoyladenosine modification protein TsaB